MSARAVIFVKRYLSFGFGTQPDRAAAEFVAFTCKAGQQMPMDVRLRVAETFVVHFPRLHDRRDRFRDRRISSDNARAASAGIR